MQFKKIISKKEGTANRNKKTPLNKRSWSSDNDSGNKIGKTAKRKEGADFESSSDCETHKKVYLMKTVSCY